MDLGGTSRRQVRTFQGEGRPKTRKCIADGLIGSSPLRLPLRFAIDHRNRWMVERADTVVCYVHRSVGGAARYVELATRKGKCVISLAGADPHYAGE